MSPRTLLLLLAPALAVPLTLVGLDRSARESVIATYAERPELVAPLIEPVARRCLDELFGAARYEDALGALYAGLQRRAWDGAIARDAEGRPAQPALDPAGYSDFRQRMFTSMMASFGDAPTPERVAALNERMARLGEADDCFHATLARTIRTVDGH